MFRNFFRYTITIKFEILDSYIELSSQNPWSWVDVCKSWAVVVVMVW